MMWKIEAIIKLKEGVLDVEGRAVEKALSQLGYGGAKDVKVGKYVEFFMAEEPKAATLKEMGEKFLANTVIETFEFSVAQTQDAVR